MASLAAVVVLAPSVAASAVPAAGTSTVVVNLTFADGEVGYPARAYVGNVADATADAGGRAVLSALPAKTRVHVCGDDLGARPGRPEWPGALETCTDVVTPAAGRTSTVGLQLADAAGVTGAVRTPEGTPAGTGYVIVAPAGNRTAGVVIDVHDGRFRSDELRPGAYTVCGFDDADGAAGCVGGAFLQARASTVSVAAGTFTAVTVPLQPAFRINGDVTAAADGRPVPGASVVVRSASGTTQRRETGETDGSWGTGFLPLEPTTVCVTPAPITVPAGSPAPLGLLPQCVISRTPPRGNQTLDLALVAGGAIDGSTTDQAGRPVGGVTVELWRPQGSDPALLLSVQSDPTGSWSMGVLPAGSYTVCFRAPKLVTGTAPKGYVPRCWVDRAYTPAAGTRVAVTSGKRTGPIVGRLIARS